MQDCGEEIEMLWKLDLLGLLHCSHGSGNYYVGASGVNSESSDEESCEADQMPLPQRQVMYALYFFFYGIATYLEQKIL